TRPTGSKERRSSAFVPEDSFWIYAACASGVEDGLFTAAVWSSQRGIGTSRPSRTVISQFIRGFVLLGVLAFPVGSLWGVACSMEMPPCELVVSKVSNMRPTVGEQRPDGNP